MTLREEVLSLCEDTFQERKDKRILQNNKIHEKAARIKSLEKTDYFKYCIEKGYLKKNAQGRYDCDNPSKVNVNKLIKNGRFTVSFGTWNGNFKCSNNNLTSLQGAPEKVTGNFDCGWNNLTSLQGGPKEVGRDFDCSFNNLTSLQGAPEKVTGNFYCHDNQLTSLQGAPEKVGRDFVCHDNPGSPFKGELEKHISND